MDKQEKPGGEHNRAVEEAAPNSLSKGGLMKAVRLVVLCALPVLTIGLVLGSNSLEQAYQRRRHQGWTAYQPDHSGTINDIAIDHQGRLWIATDSEVGIFDGQAWQYYTGEDIGAPARGSSVDNVLYGFNAIVFDKHQRAWVLGPGAVYVFDGKGGTTYTTDNSGLVGSNFEGQLSIAFDDQDRAWIGGDGVSVFDGRTWTTYTEPNFGQSVTAIAFDHQGRAWIGTLGGVSVFDGRTWTTYSKDNSGLADYAGTAFAFDHQGRAWIGASGEVSVFDGRTWKTYAIGDSGLRSDNTVTSIAFDKQDRAWIGAERSGVSVFDGRTWTNYTQDNAGLRYNYVNAIDIDKQNQIWIANSDTLTVLTSPEFTPVSPLIVALRKSIFVPDASWFVPSLLVGLWLGVLLDVWPGVLIGLALGLLSLVPFGGGVTYDTQHYGVRVISPGAVATCSGVIGGVLGGLIDKVRSASGRRGNRWGIILAIVGLIIGFGVGFVLLVIATID